MIIACIAVDIDWSRSVGVPNFGVIMIMKVYSIRKISIAIYIDVNVAKRE
jgi:hypothetical protein